LTFAEKAPVEHRKDLKLSLDNIDQNFPPLLMKSKALATVKTLALPPPGISSMQVECCVVCSARVANI
jgi:hypothetical protein